ncbi:MAG: hypothetical protein Q9225_006520, partial [Loekoesia sp. 1 TL-2023]
MYVDPNTRIATYVNPLYGIAPAGYDLKQTDTGRLFYVNRQNGAMTWHKPLAIDQLPAGWEAGRTADGRIYYINHVTKSNTWVKPTEPAHAATPQTGNSRPSVPPTAQSVPVVAQTKQNVGRSLYPQVSAGNQAMATMQPANLPNQPNSARPQQASIGQHATGPDPRPMCQIPQTNVNPQSQQTGPSYTPGPVSGVSGVQSTQPTSLQTATVPLQQQVAATNRPNSASATSQHPSQSSLPSNSGSTAPSSRPTLPNRIFSAPATTDAMNVASNMGIKIKDSMTALARNPGFQQAAIRVGTTAVQAALLDDNGTSLQDSTDANSIFTESNLSSTAQSFDIPATNQSVLLATTPLTQGNNAVPNYNSSPVSSRPTRPTQYTTLSQAPVATYPTKPSTVPSASGTVTNNTYYRPMQGASSPSLPSALNQSSPQNSSTAASPANVQPFPNQNQVPQQSAAPTRPYQPLSSTTVNQSTPNTAQPGPPTSQTFTSPPAQPGTSQAASGSENPTQTTYLTTSSYNSSASPQYAQSSYTTTPQSNETIVIDDNTTLSPPPMTAYSQQYTTVDNSNDYSIASQTYGDSIAQSAVDTEIANAFLVQESVAQQQQQQLQLQEQAEQNALLDSVLMQNNLAQEQQLLFQAEAEQNALS